MNMNSEKTIELARRIRSSTLRMLHKARASHAGSCMSCIDILAVLYGRIMRITPGNPNFPERDRFIMSKGHAAGALYATLAEVGYFSTSELSKYCMDNSCLSGHVTKTIHGVEVSTGSLGHGLPIACGMALAARHAGYGGRTFVLVGDGEMNEGSNWEALLFGAHHKLDNLVAVADCNGLQGYGTTDQVLSLEPLAKKVQAFGWDVCEIDGHDHEALGEALVPKQGEPTFVVARTVKGKGVGFMENQLAWHYKSMNDEQLSSALVEVEL